MSALALVCGVSVACSSNTSANVNTNSANTNISQENTSSQNNINNNNTNAKITSDKAKEIASATLDNYSEKELKYYDFSFFLKWNTEDGETVITGNKHHSLDEISWVKS